LFQLPTLIKFDKLFFKIEFIYQSLNTHYNIFIPNAFQHFQMRYYMNKQDSRIIELTYLTGWFSGPAKLAPLEAFPSNRVTGRPILTVALILTEVAEKSHRTRSWIKINEAQSSVKTQWSVRFSLFLCAIWHIKYTQNEMEDLGEQYTLNYTYSSAYTRTYMHV
jgi:hypothetical protein